MHYLSACHTKTVWRTQRSLAAHDLQRRGPSELVFEMALGHPLPEFLIVGRETCALTKFITEYQSPDAADNQAIAA